MLPKLVEVVIPNSDFELQKSLIPYAVGYLGIGTDSLSHALVEDFLPTDPWSDFYQKAVVGLANTGLFNDQTVFEIGMGDGRLSRLAVAASNKKGFSVKEIIGVDVTKPRLALAHHNLKDLGVPVQLIQGDAIDSLEAWEELGNEQFSGVALICLPQVPRQEDKDAGADVYDGRPSHNLFVETWEKYGLTLNAGVLTRLSEKSTKDAQSLLVLSGRLPKNIREQLISETGWNSKGIVTQGRVKQDLDTPLDWMRKMLEAIAMHSMHETVYHDVFVYHLGL